MIADIDRVTDQLKAELAQIAAVHGVAVVDLRASEVRSRYGVNGTVMARALRNAGFWLCDDNRWRAIAGASQIAITGTTSDGGTPAP
ncbi:hypothetical protein [Antarcticimicrobium luteum]|uniref:Uncharacterized protein n=1 Tax=Antarcticimicrobium luteum TaxID=2547397 RepID=A0A4R5VF23_9RHOB|nr:hypothetical protein [Antarcticimicrobium luteum]TDK50423.1 hypothetical protein E1832_06310 [Antarcticimicrobium luteum]